MVKEAAQTLLRKLLTACARDLDLGPPGASLVIAPHPDDESLGCGATIARLRSLGQRVGIVIVTDGAACGESAILGPKEVAAMRRQESLDAAAALGVPADEVVFLQFPDKGAEARAADLEAAIGAEIRKFAPRRIFSPYGIDAHADHRATAAAIGGLLRKKAIACPVYEYPVWLTTLNEIAHFAQPRRLRRLRRAPTGVFLGVKQAAIAAHKSQNVAPTAEPGWFTLPPKFIRKFLMQYELYFERDPTDTSP